MFKKLLSILIVLIVCSFVVNGCKVENPEISYVIDLRNITDEEYNQIGDSNKPEGVKKSDLKKLYIDVKITNSKKAIDRIITIPDLYIINGHDRIRAIAGGDSEQNNIGAEETGEKTANITLDSRGLTEQDLRNLYSKSEIYIAYKLKGSNLVEKRISVGDELKVSE